MKRTISLWLAVFSLILSLSGFAFARDAGKIAVAAWGKTPGVSVSVSAVHASFFLLFDGKGKFTEAINNPFKTRGGAGEAVANLLADEGVKIVVAESFDGPLLVSELPDNGVAFIVSEHSGDPMLEAMEDKGILAVSYNGNAKDAVKKVLHYKNIKIN